MSETPKAPRVNYVDNPHAPMVYATGLAKAWIHGGSMQLTFEVGRQALSATPPAALNVVSVGTLVMPIEAAQKLAVELFRFLTEAGVPPPGFDPQRDRIQ